MSFFLEAFSFNFIFLSTIGAILGIFWGAMPGLSTTMAMAILVGLSTSFSLENALVFILGVFTGSVFGGAITAILINVPGTPGAVPTQMAGYPLAKKGKAGEALGIAIFFSMIGNWIGILALIAFLPSFIAIALKFGSWEMFCLILWGMIIAGTLTSNEKPIKGWISGWLGFLFAIVGRETMFSTPRFTFGLRELMGGIPYLPVLIGVFGLTEVFIVLKEENPIGIPQKVGRILPKLKMFFKYGISSIRSGAIGLLTGIIPGGGANMASFVSYGVGEKITGRNFSEGDLEGVVCSEVANNANIGGALLPTLVLGIPGSAPTAAFLAALNLHGVIVGPAIAFNHPGLLEFIYGTLMVANFAMLISALILIKPSVKLYSLPKSLLMPFIPILCLVGAYALRLSYFDIFLAFSFGIIGFILRKLKYPLAPLVLGVILGKLADEYLRRTMILYSGRSTLDLFTTRPIADIIILVIIVTFLFTTSFKSKDTKF